MGSFEDYMNTRIDEFKLSPGQAKRMLTDSGFTEEEIDDRLVSVYKGRGFTEEQVRVDLSTYGATPVNPKTESDIRGLGAATMRYGFPAAMGASPPAFAAGEMMAKKIEGAPEKDVVTSGLFSGGVAAALPSAGFLLKHTLGRPAKKLSLKLANKIVKPSTGEAKEVTQTLMTSAAKQGVEPSATTGGGLAIDQGADGVLTKWLGGVTRGAIIGRGTMMKLDQANVKLLTDETLDYYLTKTAQVSDAEFGAFLQAALIGKKLKNAPGFAGGERSLKNRLRTAAYGKARKLAEDNLVMVDLTEYVKMVKGQSNRVARELRGDIDDIIKQISDPANVPLNTAMDLQQALNAVAKSKGSKAGLKRMSKGWSGELKTYTDDAMAQYPEVEGAYNLAKALHGHIGDTLESQLGENIVKALEVKPSSVIRMFSKVAPRADNLKMIHSIFTKKFEGKALGGTAYERIVLRPLRHHILKDSVIKHGDNYIIDGRKLVQTMKRLDVDAGNMIFGPGQYDRIIKLGAALDFVQRTPYGDKVFIQLVQGGALTSLGLTMASGAEKEAVKRVLKGAAIIFTGPLALSKILAQPKLTNALIEGVYRGGGSGEFRRVAAKIAAVGLASQTELKDLSAEAIQFYFDAEHDPLKEDSTIPPYFWMDSDPGKYFRSAEGTQ